MITGRDFIFTGLQHWDMPIGSNARDIALEISKHNRVLYFNTPLDVLTRFCESKSPEAKRRLSVLKGKEESVRQINPNLWIVDYPLLLWPVNKLPDGSIFDYFNRENNERLARYIQKIVNQFHFKDIIHIIDNDIYRSFYLKEFLQPVLSVYYRRDNLLPFSYWKKHACRLEPLLIGKSDLVLCNSEQLAAFARTYNPNSFDIGQGVDLSAYQSHINYAIPEDIVNIPHPIVGYLGDITSLRLNPKIGYQLARNNPTISFVWIGKEDLLFASHPIHTLPNVHFLGMKPKESVPAYMSTFDICINPQSLNEITIGNYPRKIDEYLAFGKPVIATATLTMKMFEKQVYLCSSIEEYQQALSRSLAENDDKLKSERITFAHSHTWENSVKKLYEYIQSFIK